MTLLQLHGLGATSSVWRSWQSWQLWPAHAAEAIAAPDLPGHGVSPRLSSYGVHDVAAALSVPPGPALVVVGHSFGGAVGLALAGRRDVAAVIALGVKARWPAADVERFAALAARPPRVLPTREEALARHLAVAGLHGLPVDPQQHADGIVEVEGGWTTAVDPRAFAQVSPDLLGLVRTAESLGTRVALLRGELDPMVTLAELEACASEHTAVGDLPGLGHSAHVEDPSAVHDAVASLLRRWGVARAT